MLLVVLSLSITLATAANEHWKIIDTWDDGQGFYSELNIPVVKTTSDGWTVTISFSGPVTDLQAWTAETAPVKGSENTVYKLQNRAWNSQIFKGQNLKIDMSGMSDIRPEGASGPIVDFQGVSYDTSIEVSDDYDYYADDQGFNYGAPPTVDFPMDLSDILHKSLMFFEGQWSGHISKATNYRILWKGDSALTDGNDIGLDLTGGFYVGGDHIKFNYAIAHFMTVLAWSVKHYKNAYFDAADPNGTPGLHFAYRTLRWGADYLMKCHPDANTIVAQIGDPNEDHKEWMRAESIDTFMTGRPTFLLTKGVDKGQDIASEMAAALAATAIATYHVNTTYAQVLLNQAESLYDFALASPGEYDENPHMESVKNHFKSLSDDDEIAWAETWLYTATSDETYLNSAISRLSTDDWLKKDVPEEFSYDDKRIGMHILLSEYGDIYQDSDVSKQVVEKYCKRHLPGGDVPNTAEGMIYLDNWNNLGLASSVGFICLMASEQNEDEETSANFYNMAKNIAQFAVGSSGDSYVSVLEIIEDKSEA